MPQLDWPSLAAPLADAAPCGDDLRLDDEFRRLEEAAAGEPEIEIGRPGEPGYVRREAKGPNWRAVLDAALGLAGRTRDLRVAVWLVRSSARIEGLRGIVHSLQLLQALLQQQWDQVHPRVDPAQPDTLTQRVNALGMLVHPQGGLADLRAARLTPHRGALTLREVELGFGVAKPQAGEPLPTREGVIAGAAKLAAQDTDLPAVVHAGLDAARAIEETLVSRLPETQRPDFKPLSRLMQCVVEAADGGDVKSAAAAAPASALSITEGAIASREDAIRALERICAWIERNEPASPAPIFIRRSQELLKKSFIEIIRDLLPDNVKQIEHFAGKGHS